MNMARSMRKIALTNNVTELQHLRYSPRDNLQLYVKRDDTLDFAFGGNKVRLVEYIANCIIESKCEKVITFGSAFSNYVRVIAATCSRLGKDCDLIILHDSKIESILDFPNLYIAQEYHSAKLVFCKNSDAHDFIDCYIENEKKRGTSYYWIPGGGHTCEAVFGYHDAALEIREQAEQIGVKFDAVFLPCGTGTTQTGLIFGFHDTLTKVIGVTVARSVERCTQVIRDLIESVNYNTELKYKINDEKICVLPSLFEYGGGITSELRDITRTIGQTDQIYLDPVYNAKSFLKMIDYLEEHSEMKNVLYVHTGGIPNIFARGTERKI